MAPPDWVLEQRLSPEERKQRARERIAEILKKQAEEASWASTQQPIPAPAVQSPSTPVLGVSLQRLQQAEVRSSTQRREKRKRSPVPADDTRRGSASSTRHGSASRSTETDGSSSDMQVDSPTDQEPPKRIPPTWYSSMSQKKWQQTGSSRNNVGTNRNIDARLEQVKHLIKKCKEGRGVELERLFDQIRDELHDLVFLQVSDVAVRRKRMLHDDSGLPQLLDGTAFPWDIQADALELYNRWALRVFSIDLLRGIVKRPSTAGNRSTDRIDPTYPGKIKADYYGEGRLVNGQWWPTQLCTIRDGAHGSTQGGIYATKGKPAFSIVLSGGNHYQDRDEGEQIWYSGTDGKDGKASENTQSLMLNVTSGQEVRVIRSHNLAAGTYRPPRGFRYDGCYEVLSYQVLDGTKMACLFHLRRKADQDPIRFRGKEMRPTEAEVREYDKFKAEIEASERI